MYEFETERIDGTRGTLAEYRGKVLLIVNTASKCVFTNQYKGLEELQERFGARGFSVLGFPCNQFGEQEPGSPEQIQEFCTTRYGVRFPMFGKVEVNGPDAHPLFRFLKSERPGLFGSSKIKWNFTKFLVDRRGEVVARYSPRTSPASLVPAIEKLLTRP